MATVHATTPVSSPLALGGESGNGYNMYKAEVVGREITSVIYTDADGVNGIRSVIRSSGQFIQIRPARKHPDRPFVQRRTAWQAPVRR